jgi:hypothetical protein
MFWRLRKLRREQPAEETPAHPPLLPAAAPASPAVPAADRAADPADDYADDPELAAYNRYLAELDARHQERQA